VQAHVFIVEGQVEVLDVDAAGFAGAGAGTPARALARDLDAHIEVGECFLVDCPVDVPVNDS
jgi:hypothetical protein